MSLTTPTEELKRITGPFHHTLDQLPLMKKLMAPDLDLDTYLKVLQGMRACFIPTELALKTNTTLSFLDDWHYHPKSGALLSDLESLQAPDDDLAPEEIHFNNREEKLGALYVLFGSTLGARFISRHVAKTLQIDSSSGLCFYSADGNEMERWNKFKEKFNAEFITHDQSQITEGAVKTFQFFIRNLEKS